MKQGKQGKQGRKSLKGTRGNVVGAPPKTVTWPAGKFSIVALQGRNPNVCGLTLRNRVTASVESGEMHQLQSRKQAGGKVGRPEAMYVLKANYDAADMVLFTAAPAAKSAVVKTRKPRKAKDVVAAPVVATDVVTSPATSVTLAPAAVEVAPPATVAPVEAVASPAAPVAA